MVKSRDLNHVNVTVTDIEKAKAFYEKVLGLKQLPRPNPNAPGAWFAVGEAAIHLGRADNAVGPHLAIEVEDYEATKAELNRLGVKFVEQQGMVAGRQLWILDPDGNKIELRADK